MFIPLDLLSTLGRSAGHGATKPSQSLWLLVYFGADKQQITLLCSVILVVPHTLGNRSGLGVGVCVPVFFAERRF